MVTPIEHRLSTPDRQVLFGHFMAGMRRKRSLLEAKNETIEFHERPTSIRDLRRMSDDIRILMSQVTDPFFVERMQGWQTVASNAVRLHAHETLDRRFLSDTHTTRVEVPNRRVVMTRAARVLDAAIAGDCDPQSFRVGRVDGNALKLVNDAFSHGGGNAYLARIALELMSGQSMAALHAKNVHMEFATDGNGDEFYFVAHSQNGEPFADVLLEHAFQRASETLWKLRHSEDYASLFVLKPENIRRIFPQAVREQMGEHAFAAVLRSLEGYVISPTFSWGAACLADGVAHEAEQIEFGPPRSVPLQSYQADVYHMIGLMMDAAGDQETLRKSELKRSWATATDPHLRTLHALNQRSGEERMRAMWAEPTATGDHYVI